MGSLQGVEDSLLLLQNTQLRRSNKSRRDWIWIGLFNFWFMLMMLITAYTFHLEQHKHSDTSRKWFQKQTHIQANICHTTIKHNNIIKTPNKGFENLAS